MRLKGVIFDLDGTVVENDYDWAGIRDELGSGATSILGYIASLDEPERSAKWAILESHEAAQTEASVLRRGVREVLGLLRAEQKPEKGVTGSPGRDRALEQYLTILLSG